VAGSTKDLNGNANAGVRGGIMDIYVGRTTVLAGSGLWSLTDDPAKQRWLGLFEQSGAVL
jgi:hypothetical protein